MRFVLKDGNEITISALRHNEAASNNNDIFNITIEKVSSPTKMIKFIKEHFTQDNISEVTVFILNEEDDSETVLNLEFSELMDVNYDLIGVESTIYVNLKL